MLIDREMNIKIAPREDGGLRVWSDGLLGLILSGEDQKVVLRSIGDAIIALREHRKTGAAR